MSSITQQKPLVSELQKPETDALASSIRGSVITPENPVYEEERKVYNAMIDKHPAVIVKCADVADVMACVKFAKERGLLTSIRAGGHNAGGLGVCDNGLVIDLSLMKGIRPDLRNNTVTVQGGCLLGDLDHATAAFGRAVPSGIFSTTGVAGLTLGGGLGHLSRKYGLSIDNLLEADVVLADGSLVTANETENPDLFWAIRGGGGNFGVVTSFVFRMQPVGPVFGGPMLWNLEDANEILPFYRDFILKAPRDIYGYFAFLTVPPVPVFPEELHLKKMCGIVWCNLGDVEESRLAIQPFRELKKPALDYTAEIPYTALQSMFDALYPKGLQWYWKADFIREISPEAIDVHLRFAATLPTPQSTMHLYPVDGACHDHSNDETAFSYRDANWAQVIVGVDPDPAGKEKLAVWAKAYWEGIHPYSSGGAYVNFMMEEGDDRVRASYRENYARLAQVKAKYDPENFFRVNQNILPS